MSSSGEFCLIQQRNYSQFTHTLHLLRTTALNSASQRNLNKIIQTSASKNSLSIQNSYKVQVQKTTVTNSD